MRFVVVVAAVLAASGLALAQGYNSYGFEAFTLGALDGQDGWSGTQALDGIAPQVVTSPDPVLGTKAVRLEVTGTQGSVSEMSHGFSPTDLISAGYTDLVVSFDIYRTGDGSHDQNLWWWLWDAGEPTYGLQWDMDGTAPHGWNPGAGSANTVFGRYATLRMEWDLVNHKAYSWYDGNLVDNGIPITNVTSLTGWAIHFGHEADSSAYGDVAYIDNFSAIATPEPAALGLLALGLLIRRR